MPKKEHIGIWLKRAIDESAERGTPIRQKDVADRCGVKPPTVSGDWIRHGRIGKDHIVTLSELFDRPLIYWLTGKMPPEEEKKKDELALTAEELELINTYRGLNDKSRVDALQAVKQQAVYSIPGGNARKPKTVEIKPIRAKQKTEG